jgi:hypothetical protein
MNMTKSKQTRGRNEEITISELQVPSVYRSGGRENIFPSDAAFKWFARKYRKELIECGAMLVINRRLMINPRKCDSVVLDVGHRFAVSSDPGRSA